MVLLGVSSARSRYATEGAGVPKFINGGDSLHSQLFGVRRIRKLLYHTKIEKIKGYSEGSPDASLVSSRLSCSTQA